MIRHLAIEPDPTEPSVSQIEVHFFTEPPLRADAEAIADNQYADHQLGIDRRPAHAAVKRRQLPSQVAKFDEPINRPQQMIRWNMPIERELIEQRSLFNLPVSHHDLQSCLAQRLNQRTSCVATEEFFNRIDPKRTSVSPSISLLSGTRH